MVRELAADTDTEIDIAVACRILGVSRSGYYAWLGRPPSARHEANTLLLKHIKEVHKDSRETYGWPRVHAELTLGLGLVVNHKRVARLMREAGIQGLYRRRYRRGPTGPATEDDLVKRNFTVSAAGRLWLTDITEHPTNEGKLYCAAVMDAYSRRIIGWSIAHHMRTELIIDALGMATLRRQPDNGATILHSDHGTQYTSWAFGQRLRAAGLLPSMGTVGDCYDNSMMESFWGTLQLEVLDTRTWETRAELANAIFEWIECWYNTERRHSSLGMLSPVDFEAAAPPHTSTQDDH
ncbi:MAG: IS3 family transposase [Pseudonocardiaceae bacterium]